MSKKYLFIFVLIGGIGALFVFEPQLRRLVDQAWNPWAYASLGGASLTGKWKGPVEFAGRSTREMQLELWRHPMERHRRRGSVRYPRAGTFDGKAQMPDEQGNLIFYEVNGTTNRSGSVLKLNLRDTNRHPSPQKQPLLQQLYGSWDGASLRLSGQAGLEIYDGRSSRYTSEDKPVAVITTMQKMP